jgi:hypothetical protein
MPASRWLGLPFFIPASPTPALASKIRLLRWWAGIVVKPHAFTQSDEIVHRLAGHDILPRTVGGYCRPWNVPMGSGRAKRQPPLIHQFQDVAPRYVQEGCRLAGRHLMVLGNHYDPLTSSERRQR